MMFLILFSVWLSSNKQDTLLPDLAWPYFISQSAQVSGYKAVKFSPEMPCSMTRFLYGAGSYVSSVGKECSLFVWCDGADKPGPRLLSKRIIMSVIDSGRVEWNFHNLVPAIHMVGPFWAGIWEGSSFPTTVIDGVSSSPACYSQDGTTWSPAGGDYFCGLIVRYVQSQLYVDPESLALSISADSSLSDTAFLTVMNGSAIANLSIDSITWHQPWILSATPSFFGLLPTTTEDVEVVCGNVSSDGVYYDTLSIFSNDPENNPCSVPLVLTVRDYGVTESNYQLAMGNGQLAIHPNPFTHNTVVEFGVRSSEFVDGETRHVMSLHIYDLSGRLVRSFPFNHLTIQPFNQITWNGKDDTGKEVGAGIYFVKIGGHNPVKVVKTRGLR
jgi:hypothetical protein